MGVSQVTPAERVKALEQVFSTRRDRMLADLQELVVRESPSGDAAAVSALAEWVRARLAGAGLSVERVPCSGRGDAVVVRWGVEGPGTALIGHLDTVWPVGTLASMPLQIGENLATGPGVFDMKGSIAVLLSLCDALAAAEVSPPRGVSIVLTPDEEMGSEASRELLVKEAVSRGRALVLEPSGDDGAAKLARKGRSVLAASFRGVAAHAGLEPERGASALLEMARFALFADALSDTDVGTTVVPTLATAGTRPNVVPEGAEISVDLRAWSAAEGDRVTRALGAYRPVDPRVSVHVEGGLERPPMESSIPTMELFEKAVRAAAALGFDLPAARVGGASDGNLTAAAGVPTLDGLGPRGGGAHARSEHLELDDLPRRAALLAALLEELEP